MFQFQDHWPFKSDIYQGSETPWSLLEEISRLSEQVWEHSGDLGTQPLRNLRHMNHNTVVLES